MGLFRCLGVMAVAAAMVGCANPGPPKPPSLYLPESAGKIEAERMGNAVSVRFTVPQRTTDGLPLKQAQLTGTMCRQEHTQPRGDTCVPVARATVPLRDGNGAPHAVTWTDTLPEALLTGELRPVAYHVQFLGADGKPGEKSDAVYAAVGTPPAAVAGFRIEGSRAGTVLSWRPGGEGSVLVKRTELGKEREAKQKGEPGVTWLRPGGEGTGAAASGVAAMVDDSAALGVAYSYAAVRQQTVQIGGRTLTLRSSTTEPVTFTLREIYPPAAPSGLSAAGFAGEPGQSPAFAVDLVWIPVQDAKLAGYNLYRQQMDGSGASVGPRVRLNATPIALPAFHDATAAAGTRYRYSVTAIDGKGNESAAVSTVLEP